MNRVYKTSDAMMTWQETEVFLPLLYWTSVDQGACCWHSCQSCGQEHWLVSLSHYSFVVFFLGTGNTSWITENAGTSISPVNTMLPLRGFRWHPTGRILHPVFLRCVKKDCGLLQFQLLRPTHFTCLRYTPNWKIFIISGPWQNLASHSNRCVRLLLV